MAQEATLEKHFTNNHPFVPQQQLTEALATLPPLKDAAGMKLHIERMKQRKHRPVAGIAIQSGFQCLACGVSASSKNSMRQHKNCKAAEFESSKIQKLTSLKNGFVFSVEVADETGPNFACCSAS
jgi:hypothetical protein